MVPLYAARISDLKAGDLVVAECGVCGHSIAIPPNAMLDGLRLPPTAKIVDLAPRLRCRECDERGRAVVSIRWRAAHAS